jgi:hypothetical protein
MKKCYLRSILVLHLGAITLPALAQPPAAAWQIGPIINGRNYSIGMHATMEEGRDGPTFAFPQAGAGEVHYVGLDTGPLQGARAITVRYRIDARPGTRFVAQESQAPAKLGLVFQRAGDTWTAKGRYEAYRWYSPTTIPVTPGTHTFIVSLNDPGWNAVLRSTAASNPKGFAAALSNTESVGLTFGDDAARGHGAYATGAARFTLLEFRVE